DYAHRLDLGSDLGADSGLLLGEDGAERGDRGSDGTSFSLGDLDADGNIGFFFGLGGVFLADQKSNDGANHKKYHQHRKPLELAPTLVIGGLAGRLGARGLLIKVQSCVIAHQSSPVALQQFDGSGFLESLHVVSPALLRAPNSALAFSSYSPHS